MYKSGVHTHILVCLVVNLILIHVCLVVLTGIGNARNQRVTADQLSYQPKFADLLVFDINSRIYLYICLILFFSFSLSLFCENLILTRNIVDSCYHHETLIHI